MIKADGLAAGKGVIVADTRPEADAAIDEILFLKKFGSAGQRVVIQEFLPGEELSFFALCDGTTAIAFNNAQDHKRAFDGDKGPNTGGMGAYSPAPICTPAIACEIMERIVLHGLAAEGRPFRGAFYCGVMVTPDGPRIFEFNARFGDPEAQVFVVRLKSDLADALYKAATGSLGDISLEWDERPAVTIVCAANGYPDAPRTGSIIRGVDDAGAIEGVTVFHAGTSQDEDGALRAAGGRVLNVSAIGDTLQQTVHRGYQGTAALDWPGGFWRRDIAWRALDRA